MYELRIRFNFWIGLLGLCVSLFPTVAHAQLTANVDNGQSYWTGYNRESLGYVHVVVYNGGSANTYTSYTGHANNSRCFNAIQSSGYDVNYLNQTEFNTRGSGTGFQNGVVWTGSWDFGTYDFSYGSVSYNGPGTFDSWFVVQPATWSGDCTASVSFDSKVTVIGSSSISASISEGNPTAGVVLGTVLAYVTSGGAPPQSWINAHGNVTAPTAGVSVVSSHGQQVTVQVAITAGSATTTWDGMIYWTDNTTSVGTHSALVGGPTVITTSLNQTYTFTCTGTAGVTDYFYVSAYMGGNETRSSVAPYTVTAGCWLKYVTTVAGTATGSVYVNSSEQDFSLTNQQTSMTNQIWLSTNTVTIAIPYALAASYAFDTAGGPFTGNAAKNITTAVGYALDGSTNYGQINAIVGSSADITTVNGTNVTVTTKSVNGTNNSVTSISQSAANQSGKNSAGVSTVYTGTNNITGRETSGTISSSQSQAAAGSSGTDTNTISTNSATGQTNTPSSAGQAGDHTSALNPGSYGLTSSLATASVGDTAVTAPSILQISIPNRIAGVHVVNLDIASKTVMGYSVTAYIKGFTSLMIALLVAWIVYNRALANINRVYGYTQIKGIPISALGNSDGGLTSALVYIATLMGAMAIYTATLVGLSVDNWSVLAAVFSNWVTALQGLPGGSTVPGQIVIYYIYCMIPVATIIGGIVSVAAADLQIIIAVWVFATLNKYMPS